MILNVSVVIIEVMKSMTEGRRGFTIVELLMVVVVIAILAVVSIAAYNGVQDRSKVSRVNADITNLMKAMMLARTAADSTLIAVTGSNCTRCACPYAAGDMTNYSTLPKTHSCWTAYYASLDKIATASGTNLESLKKGDPWGAPYAFDENEGESGGCGYDTIWSFGKSSNINAGTSVGSKTLPHHGPLCT